MSKFDLNLKIKPQYLLADVLNGQRILPHELLKKKLNFSPSFKASYFNWGRNALYYLFKSLAFKTITFPAFTCPTLTQAAEKAGKKVVLTEIDPVTFNLKIEAIPKNTECLVVVHTFGNPIDIGKIRRSLEKKVFIIEDCVHALFAKTAKELVGRRGDAILFSLYKQVANINGSLLLTKKYIVKDQDQEDEFKYPKRLIVKTAGLHQRFLDIKKTKYLPKIEKQDFNDEKPNRLSFFLFEKGFKELNKEVNKRRKIVQWYYQEVEKSPFLNCQKPTADSLPSYCNFAVRLNPDLASKRERIAVNLRKRHIFVDRLWYTAPIAQEKYRSFRKKCPEALLLSKTIINLPIYSSYIKEDVVYLFSQLDKAIKQEKTND